MKYFLILCFLTLATVASAQQTLSNLVTTELKNAPHRQGYLQNNQNGYREKVIWYPTVRAYRSCNKIEPLKVLVVGYSFLEMDCGCREDAATDNATVTINLNQQQVNILLNVYPNNQVTRTMEEINIQDGKAAIKLHLTNLIPEFDYLKPAVVATAVEPQPAEHKQEVAMAITPDNGTKQDNINKTDKNTSEKRLSDKKSSLMDGISDAKVVKGAPTGTVPFDRNSALIKDAVYPILDQRSAELRSNTATLVVEGYAAKGEANAVKLAIERAEAVKRYLVNSGVDASRITTKGYGVTRPIGDNNTEAGRSMNRRVEFQ